MWWITEWSSDLAQARHYRWGHQSLFVKLSVVLINICPLLAEYTYVLLHIQNYYLVYNQMYLELQWCNLACLCPLWKASASYDRGQLWQDSGSGDLWENLARSSSRLSYSYGLSRGRSMGIIILFRLDKTLSARVINSSIGKTSLHSSSSGGRLVFVKCFCF